jgi:hypothetical protein
MQANFPPGHKALNLKGTIQTLCERLDVSVLPATTAATKRRSIKAVKKTAVAAQKRRSATTMATMQKSIKAVMKKTASHDQLLFGRE